jgi:hypothetical protein
MFRQRALPQDSIVKKKSNPGVFACRWTSIQARPRYSSRTRHGLRNSACRRIRDHHPRRSRPSQPLSL